MNIRSCHLYCLRRRRNSGEGVFAKTPSPGPSSKTPKWLVFAAAGGKDRKNSIGLANSIGINHCLHCTKALIQCHLDDSPDKSFLKMACRKPRTGAGQKSFLQKSFFFPPCFPHHAPYLACRRAWAVIRFMRSGPLNWPKAPRRQ